MEERTEIEAGRVEPGRSVLGRVAWIREAPDRRTTLLWSPRVRDAIVRASRAAYPREACGLLLGRSFPSGACVLRAESARNLELERPEERFELAPDDFYRIDSAALRDGLEVVGVWHSHPDRPARPSCRDREAALEAYAYVIASVTRSGVLDLRSWRLAGGAFREETLLEQPA